MACEAASISSGVVAPAGSPLIRGNVADTENEDAFPVTLPRPRMTSPFHSSVALRENVAMVRLNYSKDSDLQK
jgi:hypothetical protein